MDRESIIDALLKAGWGPNLDYLNDEYADWYYVVDKKSDGRGQFFIEHNDGTKYGSGDNYLISPNKRYALTLKSKIITLHDAKKNYMKILSMEIKDIEICKDGLKSGAIILLFKEDK